MRQTVLLPTRRSERRSNVRVGIARLMPSKSNGAELSANWEKSRELSCARLNARVECVVTRQESLTRMTFARLGCSSRGAWL
jgi:hypothetical protein